MENLCLPLFTMISVILSLVTLGSAQQFGGAMPQQFFIPQQQQSPNLLLSMRYQRPLSPAVLMGAGQSGIPASMIMGSGSYPATLPGSYPGSYTGYPNSLNGYPIRNMPVPVPVTGMGQDQGYLYGGPSQDSLQGPFGAPTELSPYSAGGYSPMGAYPGMDDGRIITGNGIPFGQGPVRGDLSGVSFFPFARIRPGPGLIIISKEQDDNNSITTNATKLADNSTSSPLETAPVASTETFPLLPSSDSFGSTTVAPSGTAVTNSTQPPCVHPVYMSRVFMSTALQMGLISANTSCVVLVDQ